MAFPSSNKVLHLVLDKSVKQDGATGLRLSEIMGVVNIVFETLGLPQERPNSFNRLVDFWCEIQGWSSIEKDFTNRVALFRGLGFKTPGIAELSTTIANGRKNSPEYEQKVSALLKQEFTGIL